MIITFKIPPLALTPAPSQIPQPAVLSLTGAEGMVHPNELEKRLGILLVQGGSLVDVHLSISPYTRQILH